MERGQDKNIRGWGAAGLLRPRRDLPSGTGVIREGYPLSVFNSWRQQISPQVSVRRFDKLNRASQKPT
jgi:hypothetical protein